MKYLESYFQILIIGNLLFLCTNWSYLFFLKKKPVTAAESTDICKENGKKYVKLKGTVIGSLDKYKGEILKSGTITIDGSVELNLSSNTHILLDRSKKLAHGQIAIVAGYILFSGIGTGFMLTGINHMCLYDKTTIRRNLDKRYSICMAIAVLLILLKEVNAHVYLQHIWERFQ